MKLYDSCTPNTVRVHVLLAEKGIDVPRVSVDIRANATREPDFLALNSLGELPTLELDDGRILTESMAICRYLDALHPEPPLFGVDPFEAALVDMWIRRIEIHAFGPLSQFARHSFAFFADKVEQVPDYAATQMRLLDRRLEWLDRELADGRRWLTGERFTAADIAATSLLMVLDMVSKPIPDRLANMKRWEGALRARPSFAGELAVAA